MMGKETLGTAPIGEVHEKFVAGETTAVTAAPAKPVNAVPDLSGMNGQQLGEFAKCTSAHLADATKKWADYALADIWDIGKAFLTFTEIEEGRTVEAQKKWMTKYLPKRKYATACNWRRLARDYSKEALCAQKSPTDALQLLRTGENNKEKAIRLKEEAAEDARRKAAEEEKERQRLAFLSEEQRAAEAKAKEDDTTAKKANMDTAKQGGSETQPANKGKTEQNVAVKKLPPVLPGPVVTKKPQPLNVITQFTNFLSELRHGVRKEERDVLIAALSHLDEIIDGFLSGPGKTVHALCRLADVVKTLPDLIDCTQIAEPTEEADPMFHDHPEDPGTSALNPDPDV